MKASWVALAAVLTTTQPSPMSAACTADVDSLGSELEGNVVYTQWRIEHDAGREELATVYFEYAIHYISERGTKLVQRVVFRRLVEGLGRRFTLDNRLDFLARRLISVDFSNIRCSSRDT